MPDKKNKVDTKEFELPETLFIRDIENKVFQGIVLQCLSEIEGIGLMEGNFIDHIFHRGQEGASGISAEQDSKSHSVNIKVEINVLYGVSIPEKAEEIQTKITDEITKITGLHVGHVHVIFKNVLPIDQMKLPRSKITCPAASSETEYTDDF